MEILWPARSTRTRRYRRSLLCRSATATVRCVRSVTASSRRRRRRRRLQGVASGSPRRPHPGYLTASIRQDRVQLTCRHHVPLLSATAVSCPRVHTAVLAMDTLSLFDIPLRFTPPTRLLPISSWFEAPVCVFISRSLSTNLPACTLSVYRTLYCKHSLSSHCSLGGRSLYLLMSERNPVCLLVCCAFPADSKLTLSARLFICVLLALLKLTAISTALSFFVSVSNHCSLGGRYSSRSSVPTIFRMQLSQPRWHRSPSSCSQTSQMMVDKRFPDIPADSRYGQSVHSS